MLGLLGIGCRVFDRRASLVWGLCLSACAAAGLNNGVYRDDTVAFRAGPIPEHWHSVAEDDQDPEMVSFVSTATEVK